MSNFLQNCYFSIYSINVRLVFNFIFLKDFDSNFVTSNSMCSLLDFSKSSFSFGFTYNETANVFPFGIFFLLMYSSFSLLSSFFITLLLFDSILIIVWYFDCFLTVYIIRCLIVWAFFIILLWWFLFTSLLSCILVIWLLVNWIAGYHTT